MTGRKPRPRDRSGVELQRATLARRRAAAIAAARPRVLDALARAARPCSLNDLYLATGAAAGTGYVRAALAELVAEGRVEAVTATEHYDARGRKHVGPGPYTAYRLPGPL